MHTYLTLDIGDLPGVNDQCVLLFMTRHLPHCRPWCAQFDSIAPLPYGTIQTDVQLLAMKN
ncbi:hypothetical protein DPMN_103717 [Dreissena polymorpha]|uniref:Uncharacterized protein n=1 Tax=Dreissena polymorpha TaxID=45954 RepID=A0A9D4HAK6_DREPO|nr:hypothetical protein DPMN_103717 [Dreissena polymorpha]